MTIRELMEPLSLDLGSCGGSVHLNISLLSSSLTRQPQVRPSVCLSRSLRYPQLSSPWSQGCSGALYDPLDSKLLRDTMSPGRDHLIHEPAICWHQPPSRDCIYGAAKSHCRLSFFIFFHPFIFQASTDSLNVKRFDRKWVFFISTSNVVIVFIVDFWDDETEIRGSIYVE